MARRITREFITGRPSSKIATMPASRMEPTAASSWPTTLCDCANGKDIHACHCARLLHDIAGHGSTVIDRNRVRHAADCREPPGSGGAATGFNGFSVFDTRFSKMHVHIDEARGYDRSGGIEMNRVLIAQASAYRFNMPVANHDVGQRIAPGGGVDHSSSPD